MLNINVTSVKDFRAEADAFYRLCKRETALDDENTILIARIADEVVGIVRLCQEHGCYVLRTMQVHPKHQGQNIGTKMLKKYEQLLKDLKITDVYCMPYAHLESFYGMIGFKKISEKDAPRFLQERIAVTKKKKPNQSVILMKR